MEMELSVMTIEPGKSTEIESRLLTQLETKLERRTGRLKDLRWFIGVVALIITGVFGVTSALTAINLNGERSRIDDQLKENRTIITSAKSDITSELAKVHMDLTNEIRQALTNEQHVREEFKREINDKINAVEDVDIELRGENAKPLQGQIIKVRFERNLTTPQDWYKQTVQPYRGIVMVIPTILANTSKNQSGAITLKLYANNIDISGLKSTDNTDYEWETILGNFAVNIPGNFTVLAEVYLRLLSEPKVGTYELLAKMYYGVGKTTSARFNILIDEVKISVPPQQSSPTALAKPGLPTSTSLTRRR
jgi:hypothetical protein